MGTTQIILSANADNLSNALEGKASVTVEAEYGSITVPGSLATLAHHGENAGNPCPCSYENGFVRGVEIVGLSHLDLDSIGGTAAVLGIKPAAPSFWGLAEFVDLNGVHRLGQSGASDADLDKLHAWYAWVEDHKVFPPRDGGVLDVTEHVLKSIIALDLIVVHNDEALIQSGKDWKSGMASLNGESFVQAVDGVILRVAPRFVNHLYTCPDGTVCNAVVAYNTMVGSITVSFADTPEGEGARGLVQSLWGPEAGGHVGIAGSPRGQRMTIEDALNAVREAAHG